MKNKESIIQLVYKVAKTQVKYKNYTSFFLKQPGKVEILKLFPLPPPNNLKLDRWLGGRKNTKGEN